MGTVYTALFSCRAGLGETYSPDVRVLCRAPLQRRISGFNLLKESFLLCSVFISYRQWLNMGLEDFEDFYLLIKLFVQSIRLNYSTFSKRCVSRRLNWLANSPNLHLSVVLTNFTCGSLAVWLMPNPFYTNTYWGLWLRAGVSESMDWWFDSHPWWVFPFPHSCVWHVSGK